MTGTGVRGANGKRQEQGITDNKERIARMYVDKELDYYTVEHWRLRLDSAMSHLKGKKSQFAQEAYRAINEVYREIDNYMECCWPFGNPDEYREFERI